MATDAQLAELKAVPSNSERQQMDLKLAGRRALITGGSRGIGKAVARALIAEGVTVTIAARGEEMVRRSAKEIGAIPAVADTGSDVSVKELVKEANAKMGGIDILVNAAATPAGLEPSLTWSDITADSLMQEMNVKVMGYLRCAQAVAPGMIDRGWGRIVNISGLNARMVGTTIGSIRNVSVAAMTKNLADELGPSGINVTVIHPGPTRTEATAAAIAARAAVKGLDEATVENEMATRNSIKKLVDVSDIAVIVAFLASPLSIAINGDAIACGGGVPGAIYY